MTGKCCAGDGTHYMNHSNEAEPAAQQCLYKVYRGARCQNPAATETILCKHHQALMEQLESCARQAEPAPTPSRPYKKGDVVNIPCTVVSTDGNYLYLDPGQYLRTQGFWIEMAEASALGTKEE